MGNVRSVPSPWGAPLCGLRMCFCPVAALSERAEGRMEVPRKQPSPTFRELPPALKPPTAKLTIGSQGLRRGNCRLKLTHLLGALLP